MALDERETHHLVRVLRRGIGDPVRIVPGDGTEWAGTVVAVDAAAARIRLDQRLAEPEREDATAPHPANAFSAGETRVVVCVALARGGAFELALEHLTELGADEIVPLIGERCVVRLGDSAAVAKKCERWTRILEGACKQSGRRILPRLEEPRSWRAWIDELRAHAENDATEEDRALWVASPEATDSLFDEALAWASRASRASGPTKRRRAICAIGPEGGWTPEELHYAVEHGGARAVSLGEYVLRVPVAAAAATVAMQWALRAASRLGGEPTEFEEDQG